MTEFRMSDELLAPIVDHVIEFGRSDEEAGGFLLGPPDESCLGVIAFAVGAGVERSRGSFRVSGNAIDVLFAWAESRDLRVWAQVHSHPTGSGLSPVDERYGFSVEGFTSAVVPDYLDPPADSYRWGWWQFRRGLWRRSSPPVVEQAEGKVYVFNEGGVHEE